MANLFRANKKGSGGIQVESLTITTMPTKTNYFENDTLDLTGLVVSATAGTLSGDVTSLITTTPASGATLSTVGTQAVIIEYQGVTTSFNIDVQPITIYEIVKDANIVTEAQWLAFCDAGCIATVRSRGEESAFRGKNITISNSETSSYNSWIIADFNHDTSGDTCDLIQANTIINKWFSARAGYYKDSDIRSWLIGDYYNGFSSDIKNILQDMTVNAYGGNTTDKVKLLSYAEVGGSGSSAAPSAEGAIYPVFTTGDSSNDRRIKTGSMSSWWLRTIMSGNTANCFYVKNDGSLTNEYYYDSYYGSHTTHGVVPVIRFA